MRCFSMIFVAILCATHVFAEDEIKISVQDKVYKPKEEINLNLILNKCSENFKLRPIVQFGIAEIFDARNSSWVGSNDPWQNFPFVRETAKIRISSVNDKNVLVKFELQDAKNSITTISSGINLWVSNGFESYVDKLNLNINSYDGKINK